MARTRPCKTGERVVTGTDKTMAPFVSKGDSRGMPFSVCKNRTDAALTSSRKQPAKGKSAWSNAAHETDAFDTPQLLKRLQRLLVRTTQRRGVCGC